MNVMNCLVSKVYLKTNKKTQKAAKQSPPPKKVYLSLFKLHIKFKKL